MPSHSRKTPQRIQLVRELHAKGASTREIAAEVKLSHVAVGTWLADMGLEPNGGNGPRKTRQRPAPGPVSEAIAAATTELAEVQVGHGVADRAEAIKRLSDRLRQISTIANQLAAGVPNGEANASAFATVVKLEREIASGIAELEPPAPPDPENDPANLQAAAELRAKVGRLIERGRASARCVHCGGNPFVRKVG